MNFPKVKMFYICTNFKKSIINTVMLKKRVYSLLLLISLLPLFPAQRHEVGVQVGINNLVGDIGRTNFILQKPFGNISEFGLPVYVGAIYRMNFNPYQTLRFNLGYANVQFSDTYAKEAYRSKRKLYGTNSVSNADVQFEYNFFPVNNEQKSMLSPYIFGGIGGIAYSNNRATIHVDKPIANNNYQTDTEQYTDFKFSIPFGAGLKYKFNYNWALFGEMKFRYALTDNIDYSKFSGNNVKMVENFTNSRGETRIKTLKPSELTPEQIQYRDNYIQVRQIGNTNSKDWVNYVTLGLSYSFGRPPCYCE